MNVLAFIQDFIRQDIKEYTVFFGRNKKMDSMLEWYFRGFCDELSPWLKYIEPLPERPIYPMVQQGINFNPEWPIRVNV